VTSAEIALAVFAVCNGVRVIAYVPQIVAVARDSSGASAISYTTWGLFAVSHLSTVAYALLVLNDRRMAAVFIANTVCCLVIVGLTAWKRALHKAARRLLASPPPRSEDCGPDTQAGRGAEPVRPDHAGHARFRVLAGGRQNVASRH